MVLGHVCTSILVSVLLSQFLAVVMVEDGCAHSQGGHGRDVRAPRPIRTGLVNHPSSTCETRPLQPPPYTAIGYGDNKSLFAKTKVRWISNLSRDVTEASILFHMAAWHISNCTMPNL